MAFSKYPSLKKGYRFCGLWLLLFGLSGSLKAQTYDEFFRQKKTQQKYLLQQLAALKVYEGYLQKGYTLVKNGLKTVHDLKNGEFHLHDAFLSTLKRVNPSLVQHYKTADLLLSYRSIKQDLNAVSFNTPYTFMVSNHLLKEMNDELENILQLLTTGKLEMTDAKRMKRLDHMILSFKNTCALAHHFLIQLKLLQQQKTQELQSIQHLNKSYEIHP